MILIGYHRPVLQEKVLELLQVKPGQIFIDATIGRGGYTLEILKRQGIVIGIDSDQESIEYLKGVLEEYEKKNQLFLFNGSYSHISDYPKLAGFKKVNGIIFDLGLSSYQLERSKRGFSYLKDEPLDMRFDQKGNQTARDILNNYTERDLYEIFTKNSEELNSRPIAHAVVRARSLRKGINSTSELNRVVKDVVKTKESRYLYQILGRIYQALRIEVNREFENLNTGMTQAIELLVQNGRLIVLSYHSLEDRLVKTKLEYAKSNGKIRLLTKKPLVPDYIEIRTNSRAKSAKLRAAEKI